MVSSQILEKSCAVQVIVYIHIPTWFVYELIGETIYSMTKVLEHLEHVKNIT